MSKLSTQIRSAVGILALALMASGCEGNVFVYGNIASVVIVFVLFWSTLNIDH